MIAKRSQPIPQVRRPSFNKQPAFMQQPVQRAQPVGPPQMLKPQMPAFRQPQQDPRRMMMAQALRSRYYR